MAGPSMDDAVVPGGTVELIRVWASDVLRYAPTAG